MSMHRLPVFLSAAEYLNFTKAAEVHCISQTAVSQQIKLLEQEVGFQLFVREKRGVSLTPAGAAFYRQCKILMTQYHSAVVQGQRIAAGDPDALRIGYASAYELWVMTDLIRAYRSVYPKRTIEFQASNNERVLDLMTEGKIDMAVISLTDIEISDWMEAKTISADPCVLMISSSHPLASREFVEPKDLVGIPIVYNSGQNYQSAVTQISKMYAYLGLSGNKRMYADDFYSLSLIVNMGQAVSVMPQGLKGMGIDGLSFVPIKNFRRVARTLAVYPRHTATPTVRDLLVLLS